MVNVLRASTGEHVATINHAFEPPGGKDLVKEQTFLDPLNKQSSFANDLMDCFLDIICRDEEYRTRLMRHYQMFKDVINDPLQRGRPPGQGETNSKPRMIPPPLRGRRKWR
jgi:hypothetical protein